MRPAFLTCRFDLPPDVGPKALPALALLAAGRAAKKYAPAMPGQGADNRNGDHNR